MNINGELSLVGELLASRVICTAALTLILLGSFIDIFSHLKLCLATATHNFKWLKITHICLICAQKYLQILMFKHTFYSQLQGFGRLIKANKNDNSRDQQDEGNEE